MMDDVTATTWAVTYAGFCEHCGTHAAISGSGIPDERRPPTDKLDDTIDIETCMGCGKPCTLKAVGITRDPYTVRTPGDEDEDDDGD